MDGKLTIVDLGPGEREYLTIGALEALKNSEKVLLHNEHFPVVEYIKYQGIPVENLEYLDNHGTPEEIQERIIHHLLYLLNTGDVMYGFVTGSFEEKTMLDKLVAQAKKKGLSINLFGGIECPRSADFSTKKTYPMNNLIEIMEKLRSKEGCPWDLKQTHQSLKPYLIEEAYEVLEAIDHGDMELLVEELGDLLLQVVFHAQIASEQGLFHMNDVIEGICRKLLYRHPHVFGEVKVDSASGALKSWEEMKRKEKEIDTYTETLRNIPKHLPALMKSYKVQAKAANVGFDWEHVEDAMGKVKEELMELLEVYQQDKPENIREELGDLLFAVVNVARFLKVDPELALNDTVEKFINRFQFIETEALKADKNLQNMTLKEMDDLWNLAKIHKNKKNDKKY
ncbi:MAG: nucleoside triphosphate pyrophosphohydrolase [Bacillota bacterium]